MENTIIAISRQFASGGRLVGKLLSEKLGIPFYDKEIIELAAEKSGLSADFIRNNEEIAKSSFICNMSTSMQQAAGAFFMQYEMPASDKAFFAQTSVIRDLASKGSCVILGRCGGYILREEFNCISVFLHSTLEDRAKRAVDIYKLPEKGITDKLLKADKARMNYHKYYTGESWTDIHAYDLCINTEKAGIDGAAATILTYLGK
jgi:CMP/dCMP kinase